MSTHDWAAIIKAYEASGQSVKRFCAERGLTRSKFYVERSKRRRVGDAFERATPLVLLPIRMKAKERAPRAVMITLDLRKPITFSGSAADIALILHSL